MVWDIVGDPLVVILDHILYRLKVVPVVVLDDPCGLSSRDDTRDLESNDITNLQVLPGITGGLSNSAPLALRVAVIAGYLVIFHQIIKASIKVTLISGIPFVEPKAVAR